MAKSFPSLRPDNARIGLDGHHLIQIKPRSWDRRTVWGAVVYGSAAGAEELPLTDQLHPMTPHHLPFYVVKPGETDVLMIVMGIFLILAVLGIGNIYLRLHSLPERMAHKGQKLQFEIVAVLGLISLFTHMHIFWIAGLLLALVDLPDFSTPLTSIAGSVERIADNERPPAEPLNEEATAAASVQASAPVKEVRGHV
jgi:hypothetical protein